jgi:hypothetical protein
VCEQEGTHGDGSPERLAGEALGKGRKRRRPAAGAGEEEDASRYAGIGGAQGLGLGFHRGCLLYDTVKIEAMARIYRKHNLTVRKI